MRFTLAVCSILALIEARRGGRDRPIGRDPPAPSRGGRTSRNTSSRSSRRSSSSSSYSYGYTPSTYVVVDGGSYAGYSYSYNNDQGYNYDSQTNRTSDVTLDIIDGINALGEGLQEIADKFYENPEAFLTEIEQTLVQGCYDDLEKQARDMA